MLRRSLPPPGGSPLLAVTTEAAPVNWFVPGLTNRLEWLNKLKNSERNCRFAPSRGSLKFLYSPMSKVQYPGVRKRLRGERSCGCRLATRAVQARSPPQKSIREVNVFCKPEYRLKVFGVSGSSVAVRAGTAPVSTGWQKFVWLATQREPAPSSTVKEPPVCAWRTPVRLQPWNTWPATPFKPLVNGISQTLEIVPRCRMSLVELARSKAGLYGSRKPKPKLLSSGESPKKELELSIECDQV